MMKRFAVAIALVLALSATARATETQAQINANILRILATQAHVASSDVIYLTKYITLVKLYDTAAHLTAATPDEGSLGYALDTHALYYRNNSSWINFSTGSFTGTVTLQNGETISNAVNGKIKFAGAGGTNNEDISLDFETDANQIDATSGSGVTLLSLGSIGVSTSGASTFSGANTLSGLTTLSGGAVAGTFIDTTGGALTSAKSGFLIIVTPGSDAVITETLPAASTKSGFCFVYDNGGTAGSTKALSIATPAGSDLVVATTTSGASPAGLVSTAGASHGILVTHGNAVRGQLLCLQADGTNTWYPTAMSGTWAAF